MNNNLLTRECVGCGYCCISVPCSAAYLFGWVDSENRCRELYWHEEKKRYLCGMIEADPKFAERMAVGAGCGSGLNSWRKDIRQRR